MLELWGGKPLGLFGISMGAVSSIIAADEEPQVVAVWAESGEDELIPPDAVDNLAERGDATTEQWLIPDVKHTLGILKIAPEYGPRMVAFFDTYLRPTANDAGDVAE